MTRLRAEGLRKVYREGRNEVAAVLDVSLEVRPGEIIAIMGPSGSGKTTLLSMLGAILRPTAGTVSIGEENIWELDEHQLPFVRRRYVGFIFQSFNLFAALTAAENVEVVLSLKGATGPAARDESRRLLRTVGLEDRADFLPRDLSGGEKQRVSIARALAGNPPLILADEPTANLDWKNGQHIMEMLNRAAHEGQRGVVVVTHDHRVEQYLDRVLQFEDGRIVE